MGFKPLNSTISSNKAELGGGIWNAGILTIINSTFSSNTAGILSGGSIFNHEDGTLSVENSTFFGNEAAGGGAIENAGTMAIVNSTFSGNLAFVGGGLKSQGVNAKANVTNSTIFGNSVPNDGNGGGLFNQQGTLMIINSIIAGNRGEDCYNRGGEWLGDLTGSNNLDSDGTCPGSGTLDGLDSELADNGGPTLTHALLGGSSAIDTGDPASCSTTDQRGAERSGTCDIGAYEFGSSVPDSD